MTNPLSPMTCNKKACGGFTQANSQLHAQPLHHPPIPQEGEKREGRQEDSWIETDSLTSEAKAACAGKTKEEFIHCFPRASRCLDISWKAGP